MNLKWGFWGYLILAAVVACGTGLYITGLVLNGKANKADDALDIANSISIQTVQARRLEKDFLLHDVALTGFYVTGESPNIILHEQAVMDISKSITALESLGQFSNTQLLTELRKDMAEYHQAFMDLAAAYRERGWLDYGLEGRWRAAAHDVEAHIAALDNPALMNKYLEIRRHEKDYLLRGMQEYITALEQGITDLRNGMADVKESERAKISADLDAYTMAFQKYLAIQNRIGMSDSQGLMGEMNDTIQEVDPLVAQVVEQASLARLGSETHLLTVLIVSIAVWLLAGSVVIAIFGFQVRTRYPTADPVALTGGEGPGMGNRLAEK